ncbi:CRISPR-associated protein Cas4 [Pseudoalteromonas phenolica]|uniref:CRISPR-associated exonuclease Cas4 n=1 Tax=Pseudoalteromonas phenolica TaxID=161398 RepID=A0A4Q7IQ29_9GAMM|nr:CRISPR-associated protein Cas4 [Pseudoalteromonas phenolica]RZQ53875.1 CRISPR-associated protein Cas4 [Pseudoalteromonas phenolica]
MSDARLVNISALQHFAFCQRQCALIHLEQVWQENYLTAHGRQLHERVDSGEPEKRKGVRFERGVVVSAPQLGLTGKLDLLEHHKANKQFIPVEYKRGKPKTNDIDKVQLCAQAMCIEEMLKVAIKQGTLWYWQTRKRIEIEFDTSLRSQTKDLIAQVQQLFINGRTPAPTTGKHCKACSLIDICQPNLTEHDASNRYIETLFNMEAE